MTWGTIKVRNACPFPVTFYALAGPTIELPANSTRSAKACLIWFSTRVKGGGTVINQAGFDKYRDDYENELNEQGFGAGDWDDGGSGAAAGSILGLAVDLIENIFLVKNTDLNDDGNILFFGAKKEGVYGNSDLVVYATLDPACRLEPQSPQKKWWYLHLETDRGQETPADDTEPMYVQPDLSKYQDGMFFRFRNVASGKLLSATDDAGALRVRNIDVPFNPLEYPDYWSLSPNGTDEIHNIKILNTLNKKWLTRYSSDGNKVGLYPVGYKDYPDQHWNVVDRAQDPQIIKLQNKATDGYLVGSTGDDSVFSYPGIDSATDQQWRPESFCVDAADIPESAQIRIMHALDGLYITAVNIDLAQLKAVAMGSYTDFGDVGIERIYQLFTIKNVGKGYHIVTTDGGYFLRYRQDNKQLTLEQFSDTDEMIWKFRTTSKRNGFIITNVGGGGYHLFYSDGFGLYGGEYDDQIWVAQLD